MKALIFSIVICLIFTSEICSAIPDSCLKLAIPHKPPILYNPDSVMVDRCEYSPTYCPWVYPLYCTLYAKKKFTFGHDYNDIFSNTPNNVDSTFSVNDIDTNYKSIRKIFLSIQDSFGLFYFKRDYESNSYYYIIFSKYVCVDYLLNYARDNFDTIPYTQLGFHHNSRPDILDVEEYPTEEIFITPNPATDYIEINVGAGSEPALANDIRIYDILGVKQPTSPLPLSMPGEGVIRLDVSHLSPGVYFVKIKTGLNVKTEKLIIRR